MNIMPKKAPMGGRQNGFSTTELIVVVGIIGISGLMVMPALTDVSARYRRDDGLDTCLYEIQRARSMAISGSADVEVRWDPSTHAIVMTPDIDRDGLFEAGEAIAVPLRDDISVTPQGDSNLGVFDGLGRFESTTGTWRFIQIDVGDEPTKYVVIYPGGNVQRWEP